MSALWIVLAAVAGTLIGATVVAYPIGRWVVGAIEEMARRR